MHTLLEKKTLTNRAKAFNQEDYLRVLPHPNEKVPFKDPYQDWRLR